MKTDFFQQHDDGQLKALTLVTRRKGKPGYEAIAVCPHCFGIHNHGIPGELILDGNAGHRGADCSVVSDSFWTRGYLLQVTKDKEEFDQALKVATAIRKTREKAKKLMEHSGTSKGARTLLVKLNQRARDVSLIEFDRDAPVVDVANQRQLSREYQDEQAYFAPLSRKAQKIVDAFNLRRLAVTGQSTDRSSAAT